MAKANKTADAFVRAVEQALEKCKDIEWLGRQSPLAAPYFIGNRLGAPDAATTPEQRGQALGNALREAAADSATISTTHQHVLNASFFQRKPSLNNTGIARQLGLSEATYYRHRSAAIEALAHTFNQLVVPPLRAEFPRAQRIVGRQAISQACFDALAHRHSIALTGRSGIGKTAIGTAIANQWGRERVFWFTVRPGLNDSLSAFAFSVGHFLRGLGASNAWRQLAADHGAINAEHILGLIRYDLNALYGQPVLICIDDSDQLRPETRSHAQVIQFVEALGRATPVLSLSQQPLFDVEQQFVLSGLSLEETCALLVMEQVTLNAAECAALHDVTRGHPLLLKLSAMLMREGEPTETIARQLLGERSVEAVFARVWKRLSNDERAFLMALSVFRAPSPADAWQTHAHVLARLIEAELVHAHDGGVTVTPHIRELVHARIDADALPALHLHAAAIRESRGEFTPAAHHYVQASQPAMAVWLWFNHRAAELDKGHGPTAQDIFRAVRQSDLPNVKDRRTLALIRAELAVRAGAADVAESELSSTSWSATDPLTPMARELMGDALQMQGRLDQALARYREGLNTLNDLGLRQVERLHAKIGYVYASRLGNPEQAREEALMALSQAFNFRGVVEEEAGNYAEALQHYQAALALSSEMRNGKSARAVTQSNLGHLFMRMNDAPQAIANLEQSLDHARKLGEPVNGLYDALNLASAYIVAGRYDDARALAQQSLDVAEPMQHAFLVAGLTACAAEACLRTNALDDAEQFAMRSLRDEEDVHRPYALTTLGGVASARSRHDEAMQYFKEAIANAQQTHDRYAEAHAWLALAATHRALGDSAERAAWSSALTLSEQLGLSTEAQQAKENLGRLEIS